MKLLEGITQFFHHDFDPPVFLMEVWLMYDKIHDLNCRILWVLTNICTMGPPSQSRSRTFSSSQEVSLCPISHQPQRQTLFWFLSSKSGFAKSKLQNIANMKHVLSLSNFFSPLGVTFWDSSMLTHGSVVLSFYCWVLFHYISTLHFVCLYIFLNVRFFFLS